LVFPASIVLSCKVKEIISSQTKTQGSFFLLAFFPVFSLPKPAAFIPLPLFYGAKLPTFKNLPHWNSNS
jgi:hypothetical protein